MNKQQIIALLIIIYVVFRSLFVEPNSLEVTNYEVHDKALMGVRVVFLADLHMKRHSYRRLDKIFKLISEQKPDVVLLGGDYARKGNLKQSMDAGVIAQKLSLLDVPIFAVLGNYDWWADGKKITQSLENNGVEVLENSSKRITIRKRHIDIIGLADLTTRQPDIEKAFKKTTSPRIVLTHNPDVYYEIIDDADMIFAGHTHGGQFVIPFTPPLYVPSKYGTKFAMGLIKDGRNPMIVTKGVGTSKFPWRFNCKPEIVVVDFIK